MAPFNTSFAVSVDWSSASLLPTFNFSVRQLNAIVWPEDNHTYAFADIVPFEDPYYPASYSSAIGIYSSPNGHKAQKTGRFRFFYEVSSNFLARFFHAHTHMYVHMRACTRTRTSVRARATHVPEKQTHICTRVPTIYPGRQCSELRSEYTHNTHTPSLVVSSGPTAGFLCICWCAMLCRCM